MGTASTYGPALALLCALAGCTNARDLTLGVGEHPDGWADPSSTAFHAHWLRAHGDVLSNCQQCHGTDYQGGAVGVSCASQGCHTSPGGPSFCGTCHGGPSGPLPSTGAHALHAAFCTDCHQVPATPDAPGHITGQVRVVFSGLARANGATPTFDATTKQCSGAYCHVNQSPTWQTPPAAIPCDTCHTTPPASHQRWSRVATPATCGNCHPPPPGATHVDGTVELDASISCDTCHGHGPMGQPAPSLDGATSPTAPGVGAHDRHLDPNLSDRMGHVVACSTCHPVPTSVTQPGHLDHGAPATVNLPQGGTYDASTQSCTVWCHWNKTPGPVWTDASGDARTCTSCHGFPPVLMRDGTPHTAAQPALSACLACHPFSPATHVDGIVELGP